MAGQKANWRLLRHLQNSTDAFQKLIADGTNNKADLSSAFNFSPESYRLYDDEDQVYIRYGEGDGIFNDERDVYRLTPDADDRLIFQSAKRFRYVVQYEAKWSQAIQTTRPLEPGESLSIYLDGSKPTDEFREDAHGLEITADGAELFVTRSDDEIETREIELARPLTEWSLFQFTYNWYGVGPVVLEQVYTDERDRQVVEEVGRISVDGARPGRSPNGRITVDVDTAAQDDLEVEVGSSAFAVLGGSAVTPTVRQKTTPVRNLDVNGNDEYAPLFAFRTDPDNNLVTMQVIRIVPTDFDQDIDINIIAVDPALTDVDEADFDQTPEQNATASALQQTTEITEFPDNDGNVVTSASEPGGYQIGFASTEVEGQGAGRREIATADVLERDLHDTDIALVLARSESPDTIKLEYTVRQEW